MDNNIPGKDKWRIGSWRNGTGPDSIWDVGYLDSWLNALSKYTAAYSVPLWL